MSVADYVGRTADMLAFRALLPPLRGRDQLLAQELVRPGDGGLLVTGIEKLAQRVLLILLTKAGSRWYAPEEGTAFIADAQRGRWRTSADVEASFYAARLDVSRQVQAGETGDDPADERWGSLTLLGVVLAADRVSLRLRLVSAAGTEYKFITPLPVPLK